MRVVALAVLIGAILPNVAFVGHWNFGGIIDSTAHAHGHAQAHADQCHGSSSCADQAAHSLPWWSETSGDSVAGSDSAPAAAPGEEPSPVEPELGRLHPPPQYA